MICSETKAMCIWHGRHWQTRHRDCMRHKLEQFWQGWVTSVSDLWRWPWPSDWSLTDWHCVNVSPSVSTGLDCYVIKYIQCQISGVLSAGYKHWKHFTWTEHLNEHKFDNISFISLNVFVIENQIKFNLKSSFFFFFSDAMHWCVNRISMLFTYIFTHTPFIFCGFHWFW